MTEQYAQLGGCDGMVRPEDWYNAPDGSRWAMYAVYCNSRGKLAHAAYWAGRVVGLVFVEQVAMGPKQRRRFTRWGAGDRTNATAAEWFARSQPFTHPSELIAAADAAGQPFHRPRPIGGASAV